MSRNYSFDDPHQGLFRNVQHVPQNTGLNIITQHGQHGHGVVTRAGAVAPTVVSPRRSSSRIADKNALRDQIKRDQEQLRSQQLEITKQNNQIEAQHETIVDLQDDQPSVPPGASSDKNNEANHDFIPDDDADEEREQVDEEARSVEEEEESLEEAQQRQREDRMRKAKRGPIDVPEGYPFNGTPKKVPKDNPAHFKGTTFETTLIGISNNNTFNTVDRLIEILLTKNDPKQHLLLEKQLQGFEDSIIYVLKQLQDYYKNKLKLDLKNVQYLLTINGNTIKRGMNLSQFSLETPPERIANKACTMMSMMIQSAKSKAALYKMFPNAKGPAETEILVGKFFRVNILMLGTYLLIKFQGGGALFIL